MAIAVLWASVMVRRLLFPYIRSLRSFRLPCALGLRRIPFLSECVQLNIICLCHYGGHKLSSYAGEYCEMSS